MVAVRTTTEMAKRDPRRLRALLERAGELAREHGLRSVFVGIAGREGDLLAPEFISFVESELRVEDSIFPLTRERAVVLLLDVDLATAERIMERVIADFGNRFPRAGDLGFEIRCHEVDGASPHPTAKEVLPLIFPGPSALE
jgi:hypothetical protein